MENGKVSSIKNREFKNVYTVGLLQWLTNGAIT